MVEVVPVEGVDGAAPPVKKARYSLTFLQLLQKPGCARLRPVLLSLLRRVKVTRTNEQRMMQPPPVNGGVIKRLMRNKLCVHGNLCPVPSRNYSRSPGDIEEHEI